MANSKKTKYLLGKEIKKLEPVEAQQQLIVDDLQKKLVHAQQYYDDASEKLDEIQDTLSKYKSDKGK